MEELVESNRAPEAMASVMGMAGRMGNERATSVDWDVSQAQPPKPIASTTKVTGRGRGAHGRGFSPRVIAAAPR